MTRVLVTGGAGFIGTHLVNALLNDGYAVRVIDDMSGKSCKRPRKEVEFIIGDLADRSLAEFCCEDVTYVIHLASVPSVVKSVENPFATQHSGEVAALSVLEAAKRTGVQRVVLASSAAVYGTNVNGKEDGNITPPSSPYGVSKLTMEHYGRVYSSISCNLDVGSLRFFNVYGEGQNPDSDYAGVISIFVRKILADEPITIYGEGHILRDYIYVGDVVNATLKAMKCTMPLSGRAFNVASGVCSMTKTVAEIIYKITGRVEKIRYEAARPGEIRHSGANVDQAARVFEFCAKWSLQDGLKRVIRECSSVGRA